MAARHARERQAFEHHSHPYGRLNEAIVKPITERIFFGFLPSDQSAKNRIAQPQSCLDVCSSDYFLLEFLLLEATEIGLRFGV